MRGRDRERGKERRQVPRLRVHRARLRGHCLEARLVDFSRVGLGLETHEALRIGATYRFRLFGGRGRAVAGAVRWCRLCATRRRPDGEVLPVFRAGLALEEDAGRPDSVVRERVTALASIE